MCASLEEKLAEISAAVYDQTLISLRTLRAKLSSLVATVSDTSERFERAEQQAQLDPDNVCYLTSIVLSICSIFRYKH